MQDFTEHTQLKSNFIKLYYGCGDLFHCSTEGEIPEISMYTQPRYENLVMTYKNSCPGYLDFTFWKFHHVNIISVYLLIFKLEKKIGDVLRNKKNLCIFKANDNSSKFMSAQCYLQRGVLKLLIANGFKIKNFVHDAYQIIFEYL